MTNEANTSNTANERCLCREIADRFEKVFDVPPAVRQHLTNSRVEFLKAVRAVIDHRIEHLSESGRQGSHIQVE